MLHAGSGCTGGDCRAESGPQAALPDYCCYLRRWSGVLQLSSSTHCGTRVAIPPPLFSPDQGRPETALCSVEHCECKPVHSVVTYRNPTQPPPPPLPFPPPLQGQLGVLPTSLQRLRLGDTVSGTLLRDARDNQHAVAMVIDGAMATSRSRRKPFDIREGDIISAV